MRRKPIDPHLLALSRKLRDNLTDAEQFLWHLLRRRQLGGLKFRRQHPIPPYVLDFYCHKVRVAVELDGGQHNEMNQTRKDCRRTEFLKQRGIRVLRFWNDEVFEETEAVLECILQAANVSAPHPDPLPEGEGEEA